jgi:hypothetical protein
MPRRLSIFRRVRKTAKSDCLIRHVRLPVRMEKLSALTGWILMKLDI